METLLTVTCGATAAQAAAAAAVGAAVLLPKLTVATKFAPAGPVAPVAPAAPAAPVAPVAPSLPPPQPAMAMDNRLAVASLVQRGVRRFFIDRVTSFTIASLGVDVEDTDCQFTHTLHVCILSVLVDCKFEVYQTSQN